MPLTKEIMERIKADAKTFQKNQIKHLVPPSDLSWYHAYLAAAKAEAERAQVLVDGLEEVMACCEATGPVEYRDRVIQGIWEKASKALSQYNKPEIKQP
jgi:hypothetical protein